MRISRPGLPTVYVDEQAPVEAPAAPVAAQAPHFPPEMVRALADAHNARLTRAVPGNVTQPEPAPSTVLLPADTPTADHPSTAPAETPVEPKPAAQTVQPLRKPGIIPEHLRTGGNQPRTTPNSVKH